MKRRVVPMLVVTDSRLRTKLMKRRVVPMLVITDSKLRTKLMKRRVERMPAMHDCGCVQRNCVAMHFLERAHKAFPFSAESDSDH
jgi:hypothetical protein